MGIRISLNFNKTGSKVSGTVKIQILKKIAIYNSEKEKESSDDEKEKEDKESKNIMKVLKNALPHLLEFLKKTKKAINVHKLEGHLDFGLASFADTGQYIGYIWGVINFIKVLYPNSKLSAQPIFGNPVIDLDLKLDIDINLLKLIIPAILLISKKEVRVLIKSLRGNNDEA